MLSAFVGHGSRGGLRVFGTSTYRAIRGAGCWHVDGLRWLLMGALVVIERGDDSEDVGTDVAVSGVAVR